MDGTAPVMVGIDGSTASLRAALWAADEATARDTTLRLVYVVDPTRTEDLEAAMAQARHALHHTWQAITGCDMQVKLESEILQGDPVQTLADASRRASLICLGHKGTKDSAPQPRGSTATGLVKSASTSVAVVRRRHTHRPPAVHRWIVAVLDESQESHAVLRTAFDEAILRKAPVLALTSCSKTRPQPQDPAGAAGDLRAKLNRYLDESRHDPVDVQICVLPIGGDLTNLLEQSAHIDQLVVIGSARHDLVEQLTSAGVHRALRGTDCSIVVVHADADR
jgi:nucleotide-binding universal stress UspA family protein